MPQPCPKSYEEVIGVGPMNRLWACDRHAVSRGRATWICIASSLITGVLVYLMDPEQGRRRRHMARDQMLARVRRSGRGMRGVWRGAAAETYGVTHRIVHLVPHTTDVVDD